MAEHRVSVKMLCPRGHEHDFCVQIPREVPPALRCRPEQAQGFGPGGGGCPTPDDLVDRVMLVLQRSLQDCVRRGHVLIELR